MRIAFCQRVLPEYNIPLFRRLGARWDIEWILTLFAQRERFYFDPERLGPIRVRTLRRPPFPLMPFRSRVLNKLPVAAHLAVLVARLVAAVRGGRYDVVIGGDPTSFECLTAFLAARSSGALFVLASDTWRWPVLARDRWRKPLVRAMVRRAAVLIAGGSRARDWLLDLGAPEHAVFNVYHTNVTARPRPRTTPAGERFVLFVGRLEERKGVEVLLEAFAGLERRHRDVRLLIVGRCARRPALEARARSLGIADRVEFTGWVDHAEIDRYYERCAAFVLPSVFTADGGYEPFSNAVMEAMACGAPAVTTTANGAAVDVIEHGVNGLVVPERDVAALRAALARLLDDPDAAEAMGRAGWETVRREFNVDRMAERFSAALEHVAALHAGRRPLAAGAR
ncbi:MAG: glycosyltransferase family 4 protein [Candidatus Rokubacteria bacterium]|nr:glycosyltransferase family 4 protein [Candidatus Rokubacteria bacterium]